MQYFTLWRYILSLALLLGFLQEAMSQSTPVFKLQQIIHNEHLYVETEPGSGRVTAVCLVYRSTLA